MAYLRIQRVYHEMLMHLRYLRMSQQRAQQRQKALATLAACAGHISPQDLPQNGDIWIDLLDDEGVVIAGPLCFRAEAALTALQQTGCSSRKARDLLSDRYAKWWVRSYCQK